MQEVRLLLEEAQNGAQAAREELRAERLSAKRTAERAHTVHMRHMQAHAAELSQLQARACCNSWCCCGCQCAESNKQGQQQHVHQQSGTTGG